MRAYFIVHKEFQLVVEMNGLLELINKVRELDKTYKGIKAYELVNNQRVLVINYSEIKHVEEQREEHITTT